MTSVFNHTMTNNHIELVKRLADGNPQAFPFIYSLEKAARRDEIYQYLIHNQITGGKFVSFCLERRSSPMRIIKDVLSKLNKEKKETLYWGKDFLK